MIRPITDYPQFFLNAKQAIAEVDSLNAEEEKLHEEENTFGNSLESEQKALKDAIELTVKKRMTEVTSVYDTEISEAQDELKKVRVKREKAKSIGIRERIKEETCELYNGNSELKRNMDKAFSEQGVPVFCRTGLYYALYFPHFLSEWLTVVLYFLICFLAVPFFVYHFFVPQKSILLILIYVIDILVFGGLYAGIGNSTKNRHMEMLRQGRSTRDQIAANKKKIKEITDNINRDENEDKYNLASFDDEIAHINQRLADATMKKQEALNTFNSVTRNIIADEMTNNAKPRLDELSSNYTNTVKKLSDIRSMQQQKKLSLSDNYEVYLGKEFMNTKKIDALSEVMKHGTVVNLSEAIDEVKRKEDV